jgi:hypothetical protein
MTEFTETLRHYCRNSRCRSKLPTPVSNPRDAFCTKGCHSSFYRRRCLICEQPMERRTETQLICGKRRCRNALQARIGLGRYVPPSDGVSPLENPIKMGIKSGVAGGRAWRIVAGELTPTQLHCATVGATEAVEAINRTNARHWREANAKAAERCSIKRHDPPVNIAGGYKFPGAPVIELPPVIELAPDTAATVEHHDLPILDDLSIPEFLLRTPRALAALAEARAQVVKLDAAARSISQALAARKSYRHAEAIAVAVNTMPWPEAQPNPAPYLQLAERLVTDSDAVMP